MVKAYINYPDPHISLHWDLMCSSIGQQRKEGQRTIHLDLDFLSPDLLIVYNNFYN